MTRDCSVWEYFREPYEQKMVSQTMIFYRDGIRRDDGFTIVKLVSYDNDQYCCRGDFGEFRFIAKRTESQGQEPSERYIVYLDEFAPKWPGDRQENRKLCLTYLKDIESALLHFPTVLYFDYKPEDLNFVEKNHQ